MDIKNEIFEVYKELRELQGKIGSIDGSVVDYSRKIFDLKLKLQRLEKDLYLRSNPDIESSDIDLYLVNFHEKFEDKPDKYKYIITLHGTKAKIGEIEVRFSLLESEKHLGNLGANIEPDYRGMRYSKMAFMLLNDVMLEQGLKKPIFTVREDNISSLKSLDAIGAKRVEYVSNSDYPYYIYEYDLEEKKDIKK